MIAAAQKAAATIAARKNDGNENCVAQDAERVPEDPLRRDSGGGSVVTRGLNRTRGNWKVAERGLDNVPRKSETGLSLEDQNQDAVPNPPASSFDSLGSQPMNTANAVPPRMDSSNAFSNAPLLRELQRKSLGGSAEPTSASKENQIAAAREEIARLRARSGENQKLQSDVTQQPESPRTELHGSSASGTDIEDTSRMDLIENLEASGPPEPLPIPKAFAQLNFPAHERLSEVYDLFLPGSQTFDAVVQSAHFSAPPKNSRPPSMGIPPPPGGGVAALSPEKPASGIIQVYCSIVWFG